jgi:nucleoside-diphosphate-sugar epimerase
VRVLDDFSTGRPENLAHAAGDPRLSLERVDIAREPGLESRLAGADWVFHLAALADIVPSIERPLDYHRANVDGTVAVLEATRRAGIGRFLYAASSSCYGIPEVDPTPETAPARPQYPYALSKLLGEQCVLHWSRIYRLPSVSPGPRSRTSGTYGAVFGVFLAQKLKGRPYTVVGDGTQCRDFTSVTDVADAFVTAVQSTIQGEVFNVGTGIPSRSTGWSSCWRATSSTWRSGRASRTAPTPTSARSAASSAGGPRSPSRRASAPCWTARSRAFRWRNMVQGGRTLGDLFLAIRVRRLLPFAR